MLMYTDLYFSVQINLYTSTATSGFMKAIIITAVVVVLILAIGIPVIHYATQSDEATIDAKTLATGSAVKSMPQEEAQAAAPVQQQAAPEDSSAKEVLEQYKQSPTTQTAGPKVGYTIGYMLNQSRTQQGITCKPLLEAAQNKVTDTEAAVKAKNAAYEKASEKLNELEDADEDTSAAKDAVEAAKKAYEAALAAKYKAQDELVKVRIQCAGYLTK